MGKEKFRRLQGRLGVPHGREDEDAQDLHSWSLYFLSEWIQARFSRKPPVNFRNV